MELNEALSILKFISITLLLLFAVFLISQRSGNRTAHLFLAGFITARFLILANMLIWEYDIVLRLPDLAYLFKPVLFLYAPFLYMYTRSVVQPDFRPRRIDSLHFLPALVQVGFILLAYHSHPHLVKIEMLYSGAINASWISSPLLLYFQNLCYAIGCGVVLYSAYHDRKTPHSDQEREQLNWLAYLLIAFFIWKGIFISGYLSGIIPDGPVHGAFQLFIETGFLVYVGLMIFKALQHPSIFRYSPLLRKYRTSPLDELKLIEFRKRITDLMEQEKLYLNPSLSLENLAKRSAIKARYISQVLNQSANQNFYDFVNQYRIEESKRLLSDPDDNGRTILKVLYDVGFNSKSSFNTAFKKYVGMTPKQYQAITRN